MLEWSKDGTFFQTYVVGLHRRLDVYSVSTAKVAFSAAVAGRVNDVAFVRGGSHALVAADAPEVELWDLRRGQRVQSFAAHERRVRCLKVLEEGEKSGGCAALVTASNDGLVKVWSLEEDGEGEYEVEEVARADTKCRITCLDVHRVPEVQQQPVSEGKKKQKEQQDLLAGISEALGKKKKRKAVKMMDFDDQDDEEDGEKKQKLTVEYENDDAVEDEKKGGNKKRRKKKGKGNVAT